jgi:heme-degrading monooxygenase HmoA
MFAVMFEAHPQPSRRDTYLEWATLLGTDLRQIPGFVDDDYYQSLSRESWVLSLSTWEDESASSQTRSKLGL